ncbi:hypothetical protein Gotur_005104 [Gossypium turneri]
MWSMSKYLETVMVSLLDQKIDFLARYLSIIAQNVNLLLINCESWHHIPDSNKNQALDNIKDCERVGTTSRQKQKFTHTAGSKKFCLCS